MLLAIALTVFAAAFFLAAGLGQLLMGPRLRILQRLRRVRTWSKVEDMDDPLRLSFGQRIVMPTLDRLATAVRRLTPASLRGSMRHRLLLAGHPWGLTGDRFLALQLVLVAADAAIGLLFWTAGDRGLQGVKLVVSIVTASLILPNLLVQRRIRQRQEAVARSLPDVLDLLVVSVEAGLGFDMALLRVQQQFDGPLAEEFGRALQEINLGKLRRDALHDMARRLDVDELNLFITAIVQADRLGVPVGNVLRVQATGMRRERRQRAQELAMKAPVKMLIPLVMFIFPALFVVILGPAVMSIMKIFHLF